MYPNGYIFCFYIVFIISTLNIFLIYSMDGLGITAWIMVLLEFHKVLLLNIWVLLIVRQNGKRLGQELKNKLKLAYLYDKT